MFLFLYTLDILVKEPVNLQRLITSKYIIYKHNLQIIFLHNCVLIFTRKLSSIKLLQLRFSLGLVVYVCDTRT